MNSLSYIKNGIIEFGPHTKEEIAFENMFKDLLIQQFFDCYDNDLFDSEVNMNTGNLF
jgi:hypothetical protein